MKQSINIVVGGDIVTDHHVYEGNRPHPAMQARRGVHLKTENGGAAGLQRLLACLFALQDNSLRGGIPVNVHLGTNPPVTDLPNGSNHAFAVWRPFSRSAVDPAGVQVWRADKLLGYGDPTDSVSYVPEPTPDLPTADILVLDDGGHAFRLAEHCSSWLLPEKDGPLPKWIILKTTGPICQGDLWHQLLRDHAARLVCLVSARDLRREHARVGRGLSWEQTIEDLKEAFDTSSDLAPLLRCQHLIVTFSVDAALWLERTQDGHQATLCFDPGGSEGAFGGTVSGQAIGYMTVITASIARELAIAPVESLQLTAGIKMGLAAMRLLLENGHGEVGGPAPDGFPVAKIATALLSQTNAFSDIDVPWQLVGKSDRPLSLVEVCQRPLGASGPTSVLGLARQVVIQGMSALDHLPRAQFGRLVTAQREDIEALRNVRAYMTTYRDTPTANKPLSIGVFGPPGAGKSFGVREIANAIFGPTSWLEFNLSQFEGPQELLGAFHQARDLALAGRVPVLFWDEFDCREWFWLQYLLAPMQDGKFQEGQLTHSTGRGVFVFAGGTSSSYANFCSPDDSRRGGFQLRKGPDFISRLDTYYDVLGPNQRRLPNGSQNQTSVPDAADTGFQLRRALFIRAKLAPGSKDRLRIDPDLLDALLLVPEYRHGARSLEKLLSALHPNDGAIARSLLPPPLQLAMYVDSNEFNKILSRNAEFRMTAAIEELAAAIHERWRSLPDRNRHNKPHLDRPYQELGQAEKEDNRDAARRTPEVLALVGLGVARSGNGTVATTDDVKAHLERHIELLAEAVHDGWLGHKQRAGWRYASQRDDRRRLHDAMVPYRDLQQEDRNKDRHLVRAIPNLVATAGYHIEWL